MQAKLAEEQEMVEEYGGAASLAKTKMSSAHDSFSGGRAGGAKASEDKGAEQFDNQMHGQAAEDS